MATTYEERDGVLSIRHRAGRITSSTIWMQSFLIASCFVGAAVLSYVKLTAPSLKVFDCDRARGTCIETSHTSDKSWSTPISALRDYEVYRSGSDTAGLVIRPRGSINYRSGDVHGADIAAMEQGVARLHAFVDSSEPKLRVELPNGSPSPAWGALVFIVAFGALVMFISRHAIRRSSLVVDRGAGSAKLVAWRGLWLRTSAKLSIADIK